MLATLDSFALVSEKQSAMNSNFELKILATNWGFPGSLDDYCAKVKKEGYDGIEIWWPMAKKDQDDLFAALKKFGLDVGFLCGGSDAHYQKHLDQFTQMVDGAALQPVQRPLYINCHSGRDFFSHEQNQTFIDHTDKLAKQTGIKICHETHRSRILFAA